VSQSDVNRRGFDRSIQTSDGERAGGFRIVDSSRQSKRLYEEWRRVTMSELMGSFEDFDRRGQRPPRYGGSSGRDQQLGRPVFVS
jgi:hypothetical protein